MNLELETLAIAVHGALAFGHMLGAFYNMRRCNRIDTIAHTLAFAYDVWAVSQHVMELKGTAATGG